LHGRPANHFWRRKYPSAGLYPGLIILDNI
jgi:hypothetical protein